MGNLDYTYYGSVASNIEIVMNLVWTILIGLGASIVGGVISGILVTRKITHDAKRLYARQIAEDYELMSTLLLFNARSYLESLDYDVKDLNVGEKANQEIVNRVRREYASVYEKRLVKYELQKLVSQINELVEGITHPTTGFRVFFNKYPLQASYFDALYQVSSAIEVMIFWRDEIPKQINEGQKRSCVSNVTPYLLDALDGLLKASSEIKYYCKTSAWTWRLFIPLSRT